MTKHGFTILKLSLYFSVAMNLWRYAFLGLLLTLWASNHAKEISEQNRAFQPIEITKVTKWTDAENVVGFTLTLLASQIIIATGWIIFGKFSKK